MKTIIYDGGGHNCFTQKENARKIIVSGLRKIEVDGWARLTIDLSFENVPEAENFPERTLWVGVKKENAHMLSDDVYDAFILVPLYMAMYYKADLFIRGCVSRILYRNAKFYMQGILRDFSDELSRVDVQVEGFKEAEGTPEIIGTGFSCGVDSLSTVYDHFMKEEDPEYKINGLFMINCGWHGNYYNSASQKMFLERSKLNQCAADELGLPMYLIDSNFHAFTYTILRGVNDKMGYIAMYSCVIALQSAIKKYYVASSFTYGETIRYGQMKRNSNFDAFATPYAVHLASTEKISFIIDGCQKKRCEKLETISDWEIAQKYLNVCIGDAHIFHKDSENISGNENPYNCSKCEKCLRTQIVLEGLGKQKNFAKVFDAEIYKQHSFLYKCYIVAKKDSSYLKAWTLKQNYDFCEQHGVKLPSPFVAHAYLFARSFPEKITSTTKRALRKIIGTKNYDRLKKLAGRKKTKQEAKK